MFNGNNKISSSQICKSFFCANISTATLLLIYSYTNVTHLFLTFLFTIIFTVIMGFIAGKLLKNYRPYNVSFYNKNSSLKRFISCILSIILLIKYMFIMIISLYFIYFTLHYILQINTSNILIAVAIFILCLYISKSKIEKITRLSEILFYIIIIPIIMLAATTIFKASPDRLLTAVKNIDLNNMPLLSENIFKNNILVPNNASYIQILISSFVLSMILFPLEIIIPLKENVKEGYSLFKPLMFSFFACIGCVFILSLIAVGIFGNVSTSYTVHPLFSLMQMSSLNSNLSVRLDSLVCLFIFTGLLYSISFYLYFTSEAIRLIIPKSRRRVFVLPLIIVFLFCMSYLSFTESNSTKSPTERAIIDNIVIDDNNIYFEVYDSLEDNILYDTHSDSISDAENYFHQNENRILDFSHTQSIYVSEELFTNKAYLKNLLLPYKKDLRFPETMDIKNISAPTESIKLYLIFTDDADNS